MELSRVHTHAHTKTKRAPRRSRLAPPSLPHTHAPPAPKHNAHTRGATDSSGAPRTALGCGAIVRDERTAISAFRTARQEERTKQSQRYPERSAGRSRWLRSPAPGKVEIIRGSAGGTLSVRAARTMPGRARTAPGPGGRLYGQVGRRAAAPRPSLPHSPTPYFSCSVGIHMLAAVPPLGAALLEERVPPGCSAAPQPRLPGSSSEGIVLTARRTDWLSRARLKPLIRSSRCTPRNVARCLGAAAPLVDSGRRGLRTPAGPALPAGRGSRQGRAGREGGRRRGGAARRHGSGPRGRGPGRARR